MLRFSFLMAKDPAINWYFDNWSGGTKTLSRFLKGCYMDLLDAQFHSGHLSLEEIKQVLGSDFSAWQTLQKKFKQDESGNYFNERMEFEVKKRIAYSNSRSNNRKQSYEKDMNIISKTHDCIYNETEIGTETETLGKSENPLKTNPKKEEVERVFIQQGGTKEMALAFFNRYESVQWKIRGTDVLNFAPLVGTFIVNWKENSNKNSNNTPAKRFQFTDENIKKLYP